MRKYLFHIMLFFAIVVAVDISIGAFGRYLQSHAKGGSTRQFDNLVMKDRHDILILGSSRAHHHYDTPFLSDTLGLDVYNAGYDGNGVVLAVGILKMVLNRYRPKLVVFDVEPPFDIVVYESDNNHTRYLKNLKPYYKEPGISMIFQDVSKKEWYKVHSGLLRYNTDILGSIVDNVIARPLHSYGYAPMDGAMMSEPSRKVEKALQLDEFKIEYLQILIDLCKENDVPLIFAASPKYSMDNSYQLSPAKELCNVSGVPFYDYYSDAEFMAHKEWFKEPTHLNRTGARVFSKKIADDIFFELKN